MKSILKTYLPKRYFEKKSEKIIYSQSGEDIIIEHALSRLKRKFTELKYLDIGANHPFDLSNTYRFYNGGSAGVLVEPDPVLYKDLMRFRPRDLVLNVGVAFDAIVRNATLYQMSTSALNTFSKKEAERIVAEGSHQIIGEISIDLIPINTILEDYFDRCPELVSIDVEGLDYEIIKSIDFNSFRPSVFCIETLGFSEKENTEKNSKIINFMCKNEYFVYADTYINTVFVDERLW